MIYVKESYTGPLGTSLISRMCRIPRGCMVAARFCLHHSCLLWFYIYLVQLLLPLLVLSLSLSLTFPAPPPPPPCPPACPFSLLALPDNTSISMLRMENRENTLQFSVRCRQTACSLHYIKIIYIYNLYSYTL